MDRCRPSSPLTTSAKELERSIITFATVHGAGEVTEAWYTDLCCAAAGIAAYVQRSFALISSVKLDLLHFMRRPFAGLAPVHKYRLEWIRRYRGILMVTDNACLVGRCTYQYQTRVESAPRFSACI